MAFRDLRNDLLAREASLLESQGFSVRSAEVVDGLSQLVVIAPEEKTGAEAVELRVVLPASYPLLPPVVSTSDLSLGNHQHPVTGVLCLLDRSSDNWPIDWRVAGLLSNQLPKVIAAGRAATGEAVDEVEQGEPASAYLTYSNDFGIIVDSSMATPPAGASGEIRLEVLELDDALPIGYVGPPQSKRAIGIVAAMTSNGQTLYLSDERLRNVFGGRKPSIVTGRWTAQATGPTKWDPDGLWDYASSGDLVRAAGPLKNGTTVQWRAVCFPEEHRHGQYGLGWIFLIRVAHPPRTVPKSKKKGGRPGWAGKESVTIYPVRAFRGGQEDLTFRSPHTVGLGSKTVLVLGCGAVGSEIVEHLARAGIGGFMLIDSDTLEPGNLARHSGSLEVTGMNKAAAMARRISQINPYASTRVVPLRIGGASYFQGRSETEWFEELIGHADLVIDATAEIGVRHYSSLIARDLATSWMSADATPGIGGGTIVTIRGDSEPCYGCFLWHQYRGTLPSAIQLETALIQPAGCDSPTFVGTGFDLSVVSLQATRAAVATMLTGTENGYQSDGFDAYILALRDTGGRAIPPAWEGLSLTRHIECKDHR